MVHSSWKYYFNVQPFQLFFISTHHIAPQVILSWTDCYESLIRCTRGPFPKRRQSSIPGLVDTARITGCSTITIIFMSPWKTIKILTLWCRWTFVLGTAAAPFQCHLYPQFENWPLQFPTFSDDLVQTWLFKNCMVKFVTIHRDLVVLTCSKERLLRPVPFHLASS